MSALAEARAVPVEWFTETEVLAEFARVLHEHGYDPLKHGEIHFPSRDEIALRLAAYDGPEHVHRLTEG